MSANVWFEEVDTGLIKEIKNTVEYKNANGVLVPIENVIVRKPEEDFKIEKFPCVSIYNLDYKFDPMRYDAEPVKVGEDIETKKAIMEESAVAFNLIYQLDFWAEYIDDMNTMTRTWLMKHFRSFNLNVIDDGGTKRSCNCYMSEKPKKSDLVLNKQRLYHTIISYCIWVELDNETRYNEDMIIDNSINLNN